MVEKAQHKKSDLVEVLVLTADSLNLDELTSVKLIFLTCKMGATVRG